MLAVRTFARAAPRVACRGFATATRRSIFPLQTQNAIRLQTPTSSFRFFSATHTRLDAQAQELAAKLEQELQLESENSDAGATQAEENVKQFLDSQEWQLVDKEGEQVVKLVRQYEDESVEVSFSIADFPPPFEGEDEMDDVLVDEEDLEGQSGGATTKGAVNQGRTSGGNVKVAPEDGGPGARDELRDLEDEADASQQPFAASFAVTITRGGKPGALRVDLIAEDGEYSIQSIAHLNDAGAIEHAVPGFPAGSDKYYAGPPFAQLDEELQNFFINYLEERGINASLSLFIPDYIDVKEQREYLAWLNRVKGFLE